MKEKLFWRQGDVGVISAKIPEGAKEIKHDGVLAYGEVTGHKHQLTGGRVRYFRNDEDPSKLYFRVESRFVSLNHGKGTVKAKEGMVPTVKKETDEAGKEEGHYTHELPAGEYALLHQQEYDWVGETTRQVED